jgi:hypothetical protein
MRLVVADGWNASSVSRRIFPTFDRLRDQRELTRFDADDVEQIVDQPIHLRDQSQSPRDVSYHAGRRAEQRWLPGHPVALPGARAHNLGAPRPAGCRYPT